MALCWACAVSMAAEGVVFNIWELQIVGNTVLPAQDIERVVYPHLGADKTIDDVNQARAALEQLYRERGYPTVLVDVPEQDVDLGIVRLQVTEGKISQVMVQGSRYHSLQKIRAALPAVTEGAVLHLPHMQEQLAALNRSADRRVAPVMRPGAAPGSVEIDLRVKDELPLHASVEINDRYSANTARARVEAMLRYDNLWQAGHSFSLRYQTAPADREAVRVFSGSYLLPVWREQALLSLYAVSSHSAVTAIGDVAVIGDGEIYGARFIYPLPAAPGYFHTVMGGVDYKDFAQSVTLAGADSYETPISYLPFSLQYSATRVGTGGRTDLSVAANFSLRGVADSRVDCFGVERNEFDCKRSGATPSFVYLRVGLSRTHSWGKGWSLRANLDTQLTDDPLISNEQFSVGGADSVRGYVESEALGDAGWRLGLEARAPSMTLGWLAFHPVGFVENAGVHVNKAAPGQRANETLSALGLGIRATFGSAWDVALDAALPMAHGPTTPAGRARLHLRLSYEF